MYFCHGKTVGKIQKWLGEFTVNHCKRVPHIDAFKENHRYLCGLRICSGFVACQRVSIVEGI